MVSRTPELSARTAALPYKLPSQHRTYLLIHMVWLFALQPKFTFRTHFVALICCVNVTLHPPDRSPPEPGPASTADSSSTADAAVYRRGEPGSRAIPGDHATSHCLGAFALRSEITALPAWDQPPTCDRVQLTTACTIVEVDLPR